ncbi:MAG: glycosyltransferase [Motilibacteraceae bacterium]
MKVLLWHVHGSWTTSFVQGRHEYLLPVTPERDGDGRGRADTWVWPDSAREVPVERLREEQIDAVILQRTDELELVTRWTGRVPGQDLPAVFLEHNTPKGDVPSTRHPMAEQRQIPIVHVTHFNRQFWDNGDAPVRVIEHGIIDPGQRWTGELDRAAVVVNEPVRRDRVTGTDLIPGFAAVAPLDVYGMQVHLLPKHLGMEDDDRLAVHEDFPQHRMHDELARHRAYVHPLRWTSLGLSLLEAMMLGLPVVVLASTEAIEAVPREAGFLSTDVTVLQEGLRSLMNDKDLAAACGAAARKAALARYGVDRFLSDWDTLLSELTTGDVSWRAQA